MAGDVFISYSSKEADTAKLVRKTLESNGISCWMAPESIPAGSRYAFEIPKGIKECKIFLLILSNKSQESKWVSREIDDAINNEKLIIPFQIEDCKLNDAFNFYLNQVQRITAYLELESSLKELVEKIKREIGMTEEKNVPSSIQIEDKEKEIVYPNGDIYKGKMKNEKRDGRGTMEYSNGDVYEGFWKDDLKVGKGKYTFSNGDVYEGFFANDKFNGMGKLLYSNGSKYEGEFKNGVREGKGKYLNAQGSYYEGEYKNDVKEGYGKQTDEDGSYFDGEWKDGTIFEGVLYDSKTGKKEKVEKPEIYKLFERMENEDEDDED